jgi:hypothetical protein
VKNSPSAVAGGLFFCVPEWGVSRPLAASSFLSSLKESYQRKPLETTFQDFLGAGTSRCCACGRGMGRFVLRHE